MSPRLTLIAIAAVALLGTGCPPTDKPVGHVLSWGILDQTDGTEVTVLQNGSFTIQPSHQYLISLNCSDPAKIKTLAVWADGSCNCAGAVTTDQWQFLLPVSL